VRHFVLRNFLQISSPQLSVRFNVSPVLNTDCETNELGHDQASGVAEAGYRHQPKYRAKAGRLIPRLVRKHPSFISKAHQGIEMFSSEVFIAAGQFILASARRSAVSINGDTRLPVIGSPVSSFAIRIVVVAVPRAAAGVSF